MVEKRRASVPLVKARGNDFSIVKQNKKMAKFIILWLGGLVACDAGLIPSQLLYHHFPNLKTVYHGHGATSYQNVNVENFGSVPIPKDLQVDDGHEYLHSRYIHHDIEYIDDSSSLGLGNYDANDEEIVSHVIVSTEDPYIIDGHVEEPDHVDNVELDPDRHYYVSSDYEHYEPDHEYH